MKNITIVMGGTINLYRDYFQLFNHIEKKFGCIIKAHNKGYLSFELHNVKFTVLFCLHPRRDKNYLLLKALKESKSGETVPLPADELVKKIINTDYVIFLGMCGGMHGKTGRVYLPTEFCKIYFDTSIKHKDILKIKPLHRITVDNILLNIIEGVPARVITTNLTLLPDSVEGREDGLWTLSERLSVYGDIVDKESYILAKHLVDKIPCGFALMASDLLTKKNQMMDQEKFTPDKKRFNAMCINVIRQILKRASVNQC
ncbi:MAG: hypothetical protein JW801_01660 [Bacteroidales bacterium]|nr:hypothetical protein [Bacteroidales bacterium]